MGRLDRHGNEVRRILTLVDLLANGKTVESLKWQDLSTDGAPSLAETVGELEKLIDKVLHGAYSATEYENAVIRPVLNGDGSYIYDRYGFEIEKLHNFIIDYKTGNYYEAKSYVDKRGVLQTVRGVPKIATIGERVREVVIDVFTKINENQQGLKEELQESLDSMNLVRPVK